MKRLLQYYAINTYALYVASSIASGMSFDKGINTLFLAGIALMVTSMLAKPIVNLLLLPLNLVTFGLFHWISTAIVLYIVTLLIKDFKISYFAFSGFSSKWLDIPSFSIDGVFSYILFGFIISIITSFFHWLFK